MNDATTQDRIVVLAIVILLGLFGMIGLAGVIWLVHDGRDASAVAVISTLTGAAIGSLGTLLASTRTAQPALAQAEAAGFKKAADLGQAIQAAAPAAAPAEGEAAVVVHGPVVGSPPAPLSPLT